MGLKVGSLYVSLTARTGAFVKGLDRALGAVEKAANQMKRATKDVAQLGAGFVASMGGAIAIASKYDQTVADAAKRSKDAFVTVSVEIARALLPALNSMNAVLVSAIAWWQHLSAGTRENTTEWVLFAAKALSAVTVLHILADKIEGFAELARHGVNQLSLFGEAVKRLGPNFLRSAAGALPLIAALGLVYVASAVMRAAWNKSFSGMADDVVYLWKEFVAWAEPAFVWMGKALDSLRDLFSKVWGAIRETVLGAFQKFLEGASWILEKLGVPIEGVKEKLAEFATWIANTDIAAAATTSFQYFGKVARDTIGVVGNDVDFLGAVLNKTLGTVGAAYAGLGALRDDAKLVDSDDELEKGFEFKLRGNLDTAKIEREASKEMARLLAGAPSAVMKAVSEALAFIEQRQLAAERYRVSASKNLYDAATSALERLPGALSNIVRGFSEGGIWGAIGAMLVEILQMSERFNYIIETIMEGFGMLAKFFDGALAPIADVNTATNEVLSAFMEAMTPFFEAMREFQGHLAPFIGMLKTLSPLLSMIMQSIAFTLMPIVKILDFVFGAIYELVKGIILVVLKIGEGLAGIWNAIDSLFSGGQAGAAHIDLRGLWKTMGDLEKSTYGSARANNRAEDSATKLADSFDELTESLSNVPDVWRIASARYGAQDPSAPVLGSLGPGMGGGGTTINVYVAGSLVGISEFAEQIESARNEVKKNRYGGRYRNGNSNGEQRPGKD